MILKTADVHIDRLDFRSASSKRRTASDKKTLGSFEYEERPGYLYVACRALTADVPNLNYDMFPSEELETAYETFKGAYFYLNHDQNPDHARGAVIDAAWHPADEEGNDDENGWVEILIEVDEQRCPKLCELLKSGEINTFSMGCNCESTKCSVCGNVSEFPYEYCEHVQQKGREFQGQLAYEICNGVEFIEESAVYDPADPNAQTIAKSAKRGCMAKNAKKSTKSAKVVGRTTRKSTCSRIAGWESVGGGDLELNDECGEMCAVVFEVDYGEYGWYVSGRDGILDEGTEYSVRDAVDAAERAFVAEGGDKGLIARRKASRRRKVSTDLSVYSDDDYQNRGGGDYLRSGVPDDIQGYDGGAMFSFKDTSEDAAEKWVRRWCERNGIALKGIWSWQDGDYYDDWVAVKIEV